MRIFVAGGTGAVGRHLVPALVKAGHEVTATSRTEAGLALLESQGAAGVRLDVLDADELVPAGPARLRAVAGVGQ
ncbi:NAD(P)H-binding protein, partial [Nonomuraea fuscirosea]